MHGGASALSIAAAVISLVALMAPTSWTGLPPIHWGRNEVRLCVALASPLAAVLVSSLAHWRIVPSTLDSPSRFLAAVSLMLVLCRSSTRSLIWADLSFALGAFASLGIMLLVPRDWGHGRLGSPFLNPIHFGDIALALGVLSVLSLNWWKKDSLPVRILKIVGLFAGLATSLLSGARGGWIAVPIVVALSLYVRSHGKSRMWKVLTPLAVAGILASVYVFSPTARGRIDVISSDLKQYSLGNKDTSVGVRLQLYEAALTLIREHPVVGLGGDGFRDAMNSLAEAGALTPLAAQFGKGETHNQLLAYLANYGVVGGLALLAIYVVPGMFFWRCANALTGPAGRAGLMGLTFVVAFSIFGFTVETFDLKATVAFYSTVVAILAAISSHNGASSTRRSNPAQ
ncbi:O-antigen ligase family protein [Paraburkholderia saeva]|uniref:O-antigen ligase family protein n=1 Tax=Paraburkholderia saeva TaxID=2777537 RepID=UPI002B4B9A0C|nr:O-antigen ligase family protein [Paraburkholderia saeva]